MWLASRTPRGYASGCNVVAKTPILTAVSRNPLLSGTGGIAVKQVTRISAYIVFPQLVPMSVKKE